MVSYALGTSRGSSGNCAPKVFAVPTRGRTGPAHYPDHTHAVETAHVILEGEMTLTCNGVSQTYKAGERAPDVPAGAVHSARMGPGGCRYLIGEK